MFSSQNIFTKNNVKWIILFLLLFITFFSSLFMGRYTISPENTFIVLINALQGNIAQDMNSSIILGMRLPRTILSMLLGAGLAIAGSTYQGIFRNPLVSPDVLGVSSGAGFGSVLGILLFGMSATTSILAFLFGLGSVFLTYLFARARRQTTMMSLVLSGMIVSVIFAALISLVKYVADPYDTLPAITYWLMGISKATFEDLRYLFIPLAASLMVLNLCTQLSGGQLQLVYIARALVAKPQILILDEPETHLDFNNQHMLMNLIQKITDEKELCCIINTHYPDYALKISNVSLLMKKGEHSFGNTQELLTPQNMKTYFDMKTKLIELDTDEGIKKSLVVL